jgi:hypothetical protein
MFERKISVVLALVLLAGCATPQETCIASATRDLTVMDGLIAQTRANIQRGYAIEERQIAVPVLERCERIVIDRDGTPKTERYFCQKDTFQTIREPKAIDLAAETRKLEGMLARRARMISETDAAVASCRLRHPK